MNYKEFRPGNLVNVSGKPETITGILQFGMYFHLMYYPFNLSQIEPITMTKDWLIKCKLKPTDDYFFKISIGNGNTLEVCVWAKRTIIFNRKKLIFIELKFTRYVHQLQNLYFALTGNELTIKQDLQNVLIKER